MQDVAQRIDQSCHRCANGQRCFYANASAAYIWIEVELRLQGLSKHGDDIVWSCNAQRRILNLMWHYRCAAMREIAEALQEEAERD